MVTHWRGVLESAVRMDEQFSAQRGINPSLKAVFSGADEHFGDGQAGVVVVQHAGVNVSGAFLCLISVGAHIDIGPRHMERDGGPVA